MLTIKALHIIFVICWYAGLFYLPRLFVYHAKFAKTDREYSLFYLMEKRLYYYIMCPSAFFSILFGILLLQQYPTIVMFWFGIKFLCILLLVIYHVWCGVIIFEFKTYSNKFGHVFFRFFNEFPTIILFIIVFVTIFKPT